MTRSFPQSGIVSLDACPPGVLEAVAAVYLQEWGWHYATEWDVEGMDAMVEDLRRDEYVSNTYAVFSRDPTRDAPELLGTVALLACDLKSHSHLRPWVTCL